MKQLALSYFDNPELALIPMIIFIVFFVVLLISVFSSANKNKYEYLSKLPLEDEVESYETE